MGAGSRLRSWPPVQPARRLGWPGTRDAVVSSTVLALACALTYWLVTGLLAHVYSPSGSDPVLGGMWAVIATIFVFRQRHEESTAAAVSRMAATTVSFLLCLIYLLFLPFHIWGMALLAGIGVLIVTLLGRPQDAVTTGITTVVVMVVAELNPHNAWQQPILRFADTVVGVAVGLAAAWAGLAVTGRLARGMMSAAGSPDGGRRGR